MNKFSEITGITEFMITDTDMLLVSEECLEKIAIAEGWLTEDDEYGVSSCDLCDIASNYRLINLGDLGNGFVFVADIYGLKEENIELYNVLKKYKLLRSEEVD